MKTPLPSVYISKLDAAKRQLETAIQIFFKSGDIVSIHTLAYAAHTLLYDLGKTQNIQSLLKDQFVSIIKPDKKDEIINKLNKSANFFKHADRDSSDTHEFNSFETELFILDGVLMYTYLTKEWPPILHIYRSWYFLEHPEHLLDGPEKNTASALRKTFGGPINKLEFFLLSMETIAKQGSV